MTNYESKVELTQAEYIELKRESGHGSVGEGWRNENIETNDKAVEML